MEKRESECGSLSESDDQSAALGIVAVKAAGFKEIDICIGPLGKDGCFQHFRKENQVYRQTGVQLCPLRVPEGLWPDKAGKRGRNLVFKGLV